MQTVPQPLQRKPVLKAADSRYVSLFSDASNNSDITVSDGHKGLLPKSTKLYEVGIDNLTLSMNGLSMLTPSATEPIILEILALRMFAGQNAGVCTKRGGSELGCFPGGLPSGHSSCHVRCVP